MYSYSVKLLYSTLHIQYFTYPVSSFVPSSEADNALKRNKKVHMSEFLPSYCMLQYTVYSATVVTGDDNNNNNNSKLQGGQQQPRHMSSFIKKTTDKQKKKYNFPKEK